MRVPLIPQLQVTWWSQSPLTTGGSSAWEPLSPCPGHFPSRCPLMQRQLATSAPLRLPHWPNSKAMSSWGHYPAVRTRPADGWFFTTCCIFQGRESLQELTLMSHRCTIRPADNRDVIYTLILLTLLFHSFSSSP